MIKPLAFLLFLFFQMPTVSCQTAQSRTPPAITPRAEGTVTMREVVTKRLDILAKKAERDLGAIPVSPYGFPFGVNTDNTLRLVPSSNWVSGFYPGTLWQLYEHNKSSRLREAAETWTSFIEREQYNASTHDLGFMVYCSFGNGWRITDNKAYEPVIIQTAKTLADRYSETVGCIRSWDWNADVWSYPVIIDNMMNLELLYAAAKLSGDKELSRIATRHAETTMNNHYRDDNSCYHVIDYDPVTGEVRNRQTFQGETDDSAWARGQSWGLYGFAMAYKETGDRRFLEHARKIADFFFNHPRLPEDQIPYWDFDAADIPNAPRDVSAATVAACGLLRLAEADPDNKAKYLGWTDGVLMSLEKDIYQTNRAPFLLDHSTGAKPLGHEIDRPISYADYYYVEALRKRLMYD